MMRNKYPIAFLPARNVSTDFNYLPGYFMPEHKGGFRNPIPFKHVTTADPTRPHLDKKFIRPYARYIHLLDPDILVVIIHCDFH